MDCPGLNIHRGNATVPDASIGKRGYLSMIPGGVKGSGSPYGDTCATRARSEIGDLPLGSLACDIECPGAESWPIQGAGMAGGRVPGRPEIRPGPGAPSQVLGSFPPVFPAFGLARGP